MSASRCRGDRARARARRHARVPRPHLRVALPAEGAADRSSSRTSWPRGRRTRSPTPPAPATTPATASAGRPPVANVVAQPHRASASRMSPDEHRAADRREHDLGRRRGRARDVHAGGLRVPRGGPDADEERRATSPARTSSSSASPRSSTGRSASGSPSATANAARSATHGFAPSVGLAARGRARRRTRSFTAIPGAAGYLFEVVFAGVSLAIVWGAMAERAKLWVYFVFGAVFTVIYSVVSHWIWAPSGWLFAARDAGLRRLDGRPLPGRARRARRRAPARPADRQVRPGRRGPTRSPATTCRTPCSGRSSSGSAGSASTRARRSASSRAVTSASSRYVALTTNLAAAAGALGGDLHRLARPAQAGHLDDAERRARGARRGHRGVRASSRRGPRS